MAASSTLTGSSLVLVIVSRSLLHDLNDTSAMSAAWSASEQPKERPSRTSRIGWRGMVARSRTPKGEHDRPRTSSTTSPCVNVVV
jgi:hypothetical protein